MPLHLRKLGRQWDPRPVRWPGGFFRNLVLRRHMYPLVSPLLDAVPISAGMRHFGPEHLLIHRGSPVPGHRSEITLTLYYLSEEV